MKSHKELTQDFATNKYGKFSQFYKYDTFLLLDMVQRRKYYNFHTEHGIWYL